MKKLAYRSLILSFLFLFTFSTITAQEPPEDSNLIVIDTEDSGGEAFKTIGKLLLKEGFKIDLADRDFMMITTLPKKVNVGFLSMQKLAIRFTIEILEEPTRISFYVEGLDLQAYDGLVDDVNFDQFGFRGAQKSGAIVESFEELDEFVKKYPNGKISYEIVPLD